MAKTGSISPTIALTALAGFLSGGLAGAVFNWYVNKPEPTLVTYTVNRTPLAAPEASGLIPGLKISVGDEAIQELYAYTVDVEVSQGPRIDQAQVGVFFPRKIRIYGTSTESPSPLHSIACQQLDQGLQCSMSPMLQRPERGYRITLATNDKEGPSVEMVTKGVELLTTAEFVARKSRIWGSIFSTNVLGEVGLGLAVATLFLVQLKYLKPLVTRQRVVVVGKITDTDGLPLKGAVVEVKLESPERTFAPVETDRFGDFILGGLSKISLLKGRIRITHAGYISAETQFDSPIIHETLQRNNPV